MIRGEKSIPVDLVMEILSRLPVKSIVRFSCVSKVWGSMLGRPYFTQLFMTRSLGRPRRLLLAVEQVHGDWCFFSSPQPHNPYEKSSSLVLTADFHMKLPREVCLNFVGYASGLIYFEGSMGMAICNPSTPQYSPVPKEINRITSPRKILGFDPIGKQFKLLSISFPPSLGNQILTLGTGDDSWRKIHSPLHHFPSLPRLAEGLCINGVLYYLAEDIYNDFMDVIVCFDVRSEKFQFINIDITSAPHNSAPQIMKLINYKGKLGMITMNEYDPWNDHGDQYFRKLWMWVIKGVEKRESEWSLEYVYTFRKNNGCNNVSTLWEDQVVSCNNISVAGVTAEGEIVLLMNDLPKPFCIFYLNPERNTLQRVDIRGLGAANDETFEKDSREVRVFVDYVEDLKFINMKKT